MLSDTDKLTRQGEVMRTISLFAGCGGLDLGLQGGFTFNGKRYSKHPFEIVWANELSDIAASVYDANFRHGIVRGDIQSLLDNLPHARQVDVVCGGFPCQDVSINGKLSGAMGKRTTLYKVMLEVVKRTKPKIVLAENVKGILLDRNKSVHEGYLRGLKDLGYHTKYKLYLVASYGVPQMRERVVYVSTCNTMPLFDPPAPVLDRNEFITCKEIASDLPAMTVDKEFAHIWSYARPSNEQGSRKLHADKPAQTIRAESHGNNQFHYEHPRRISMREAARFQSFPDRFKLFGGIRAIERMVGNAVPPVFAWHIAKALREQYL